jgi:hypothetical protein
VAEGDRKQSAEAEGERKQSEAAEGEKAKANLRQELQARGKEKCKFYPFCKNLEDCEYFHPTERVNPLPHSTSNKKINQIHPRESQKIKKINQKDSLSRRCKI